MAKDKQKIKGILLDLEGTLIHVDQWLSGGKETIEWLLKNKIPFRIMTNATMRSRKYLQDILKRIGYEPPLDWIFTPARVAYLWLKNQTYPHGILPLIHSKLREDFLDLPLTELETADAVLVGDMGQEWRIEPLNKAFRALMNNAQLLALETNRFWKAKEGLRMDAGAFIAALEYSSHKKCEMIFGKPSPTFFETALNDMGVKAADALMVGDDLESDVLGAQACGIKGILVQTGKFQPNVPKEKMAQASGIIQKISDLQKWITK